MCECKDRTCADTASQDLAHWSAEGDREVAEQAKVDPDLRNRVAEAMKAFSACFDQATSGWQCETEKDAKRGTETKRAVLFAKERRDGSPRPST